MGVPTFIHESNAIPGKANRLNARSGEVVLLGFAECAKYFPQGSHRSDRHADPRRVARTSGPAQAQAAFRFAEGAEKKTLLIMGGSQGAHGINEADHARCCPNGRTTLQIIHFTGRDDEAAMRAAYESAGVSAYVAAFHHRMQEAYSAADFVVARSGAASLSELAYFGLPSLLIPYPFAAEDHQTFNAQIFARGERRRIMLKERETTGDYLAKIVLEILRKPAQTLCHGGGGAPSRAAGCRRAPRRNPRATMPTVNAPDAVHRSDQRTAEACPPDRCRGFGHERSGCVTALRSATV